jgi:probable rRNA maturation factor
MFRRDDLLWLAERVCAGERAAERLGDAAELSVLFCDDPFIAELNRTYRHVDDPTDVLSFGPSPEIKTAPGKPAVLGDIVVSLETVERRCGGDRAAMRKEIRLLLCHGLLHLLGSQHDTAGAQTRMAAKQAQYLGMEVNAAWGRPVAASRTRRNG